MKKTPIRGKNYLHDFLPVSLNIHIFETKGSLFTPDASPILLLMEPVCYAMSFSVAGKKDISCKFLLCHLQSDYGQQIIKENVYHTNVDSVILVKDGKAYIYSRGNRYEVLLGGFYKLMGRLGLLFPPFGKEIRYTNSSQRTGTNGLVKRACMIPDHRIRKRFID